MKLTAHFRHPTGMPYPDRDWIMAYATDVLRIEISQGDYNKIKRDAVLTEEIDDTKETGHIYYTVDYEATEIDPESGIEQDLKVTSSVVYYG